MSKIIYNENAIKACLPRIQAVKKNISSAYGMLPTAQKMTYTLNHVGVYKKYSNIKNNSLASDATRALRTFCQLNNLPNPENKIANNQLSINGAKNIREIYKTVGGFLIARWSNGILTPQNISLSMKIYPILKNNLYKRNIELSIESKLIEIRQKADNSINYTWTAANDIKTWNGSVYVENGQKSNVFKEGKTYKGIPYTLFAPCSLEKYQEVSGTNRTYTGEAFGYGKRTGPLYGSCCMTFVSECWGLKDGTDLFHGIGRMQDRAVKSGDVIIINNATVNQMRSGDGVSVKGHIILINEVSSDKIIIDEQTPPSTTRTVLISDDGGNTYHAEGNNPCGYKVTNGVLKRGKSEYTTINRLTELNDLYTKLDGLK